MSSMTSLTYILRVNFVTNLDIAFSLNYNWQDDIEFIGSQSTWFGVWNFRMAHVTLAHAQMNYHVSQFGHWNQEKADK